MSKQKLSKREQKKKTKCWDTIAKCPTKIQKNKQVFKQNTNCQVLKQKKN